MTAPSYLIGIDQGSSGSRALVLDRDGQVRGYGYRPLARHHPRPGWVEQDPWLLADGVRDALAESLAQAGVGARQVAAVGIACQRNTDFAWDSETHQAIGAAISWQDLRTLPMVEEVAAWEHGHEARHRLGYAPGPYSSALHVAWRMRHDPEFATAARAGRLRLGLSAAWLLQAMGEAAGHQMDVSLVQAMGMYDFRAGEYWDEWLAFLGIPRAPLPDATPSVHEFGALRLVGADGEVALVPMLAMIGDQQGALFGYDRRHPGDAECTHGTASFVDVCVGAATPRQERINVYYAWQVGDATTYCLEADTTVSGAAIRWMRERARLFDRDDEVGPLAASVPDAGGVVFVPAFTGLNVPYNDQDARGTLLGMTLGSSRAHIVRAFLDSLGYQVRAILDRIHADTGLAVDRLYLGGGVSVSNVACQIQADWLGIPTVRPQFTETTARAAALLAGLGVGWWPSLDALPPLPAATTVFEPHLSADERDAGYARWNRAVEAVRLFGTGE